jgi:very-short-patch-repair endonuclease
MRQPYKDDTKQERLVADALEECGYAFMIQCDWFKPYIVDFYLPELGMVVEADGHYGHFSKRDKQRDLDLQNSSMVEYVLHVTGTNLKDIKEELWLGLEKYQEEQNQKLNGELPLQ